MTDNLSFDLSQAQQGRWYAYCDACHYTLSDAEFSEAERRAGPETDPPCPGCSRKVWCFEREE